MDAVRGRRSIWRPKSSETKGTEKQSTGGGKRPGRTLRPLQEAPRPERNSKSFQKAPKTKFERSVLGSVGVLLFEMMTGQPPFHAANPIDIYRMIVAADYTMPAYMDPAAQVSLLPFHYQKSLA